MRDGGAIRGSKYNTGVMGGDEGAIREQTQRVKAQEVADERAGLLDGEEVEESQGRPGWGNERAPTPGRAAGLEVRDTGSFNTHPATATYGREEVNITKCQIIGGVLGVAALVVSHFNIFILVFPFDSASL